ncbi:MAG: hypothetical protein JXL81_04995 [Deltaproteobacteria bacterium]|nr:hypothetical protein [Deltaproteobacteria bacterium]
MLIKEVISVKATLPFAHEFSHSLRKRISITNVFVLLKDGEGILLGCGEGAPRSYVTGENPDSVITNISRLINDERFPWEIYDADQIWNYLDSLSRQKDMNAAICALEMALLDAFAREKNMQIIDFFPHDYYSSPVRYSAVIPLADEDIIKHACRVISNLGINRLKLKIGKDFSQNKAMLRVISENIPGEYDLRVDVNGVWDRDTAVRHLPLLLENNVRIIEQPMAPDSDDITFFHRAARDFNITLMADESACSFEEIEKIASDRYYGMVNVRVSKCGGLRRSIKIIDYLRSMGISFQIGCQLGESGLLSAAGRALSLLCNDADYYEGSYDDLLLSENITTENVSFEYGGIANPLPGNGLGVDADHEKIKKLSNYTSIKCFKKP